VNCWLAERYLNRPCDGEGDAVLTLPDLRQRNDWTCGEVVARIVAGYWGARLKRPLATPIDGTDPRGLEGSLRLADLNVLSGSMDVADLQYHTRRGRPVICLVTEAGGVGHYVVVGGVRRGVVYMQCPADGWVREPVASFERRWRDVDRCGTVYVRWAIAAGL
jgi:hypothetical protein